jgi:FkbM family methyltransferase
MRPLKQFQALLARLGILAYRKKCLSYGLEMPYDIERLFGQPRTVLDVGANVGQTARELSRAFPAARVYSFEPVPTTFEQLKRNTAGLSNVRCFLFGLGAAEEQATIRLAASDARNSLLNQSDAGEGPTATITIKKGDEWAAGEGVTSIDLLKTDTEGYDLEVLRGFGGMLKEGRIRAILAECEFDRVTPEPHTSFLELHRFLTPQGYRVVTFYTDHATPRGLAWGNVLFAYVAEGGEAKQENAPGGAVATG